MWIPQQAYCFVLRLTRDRQVPLGLGLASNSECDRLIEMLSYNRDGRKKGSHTRVGTLIVATIYLQLIQNRYMFRSFTVLQCSHQHCVQPVASDVEVVGYL